jgi:hypothetical protein
MHGIERSLDHKALVKAGQSRAIKRGAKLGPINQIILVVNGRKQTIEEWANELGIGASTLRGRLRRGWSHERTLTERIHRENGITPQHRTGMPPSNTEIGIETEQQLFRFKEFWQP